MSSSPLRHILLTLTMCNLSLILPTMYTHLVHSVEFVKYLVCYWLNFKTSCCNESSASLVSSVFDGLVTKLFL